MDGHANVRVESEAMADFAGTVPCSLLRDGEPCNVRQSRFNLDPENVKNGLAQLVLTLVKLLHELLERQAIRRIEAGSLTDAQVDRLGRALMRQSEVLEQLRQEFGLEEADLNLDLGPMGFYRRGDHMPQAHAMTHAVESATLAVERVLDKGVVIAGDIKIKLVDIELLSLQLRLVICSVDKAREMGMDWWVNNPAFCSRSDKGLPQDSLTSIEERLTRLEHTTA